MLSARWRRAAGSLIGHLFGSAYSSRGVSRTGLARIATAAALGMAALLCAAPVRADVVDDEPAAVSPAAGQIELYARGGSGDLLERLLDGSGWSDWSSLGGGLSSGPRAIQRDASTIDVFARGTGNTSYTVRAPTARGAPGGPRHPRDGRRALGPERRHAPRQRHHRRGGTSRRQHRRLPLVGAGQRLAGLGERRRSHAGGAVGRLVPHRLGPRLRAGDGRLDPGHLLGPGRRRVVGLELDRRHRDLGAVRRLRRRRPDRRVRARRRRRHPTPQLDRGRLGTVDRGRRDARVLGADRGRAGPRAPRALRPDGLGDRRRHAHRRRVVRVDGGQGDTATASDPAGDRMRALGRADARLAARRAPAHGRLRPHRDDHRPGARPRSHAGTRGARLRPRGPPRPGRRAGPSRGPTGASASGSRPARRAPCAPASSGPARASSRAGCR